MDQKSRNNLLQADDYIIILSAFILFLMFGMSWFFNSNSKRSDESVKMLIKKGMSFSEVVDSLHKFKLIDSKLSFFVVGKLLGTEKKIKSGFYSLPYGLSNYDYLNILVTGKNRIIIKLTIFEGMTLKQLAQRCSIFFNFSQNDFMKAAQDKNFLKKYEIGHSSIEGYILPATYEFWGTETPEEIIESFLKPFKNFYDHEIKPFEKKLRLSKNQIITLASIIEGETNHIPEMRRIAGVYLNRLKRRIKLQADPTIAYITEKFGKRITYNDLKLDSPYNTYLYFDLPPGPINFPRKEAIKAAVEPEHHDYLYFVASGDGNTHVFSKTYSEHQKRVAEYRKSINNRR